MAVLILEASTSAAKAMAYDREKGILAMESEPFPQEIDRDGTQDTEGVFQAVLDAGRRVAAGREITAIALGGVWHSVAVCDDAMRPVCPSYTWTYTGASDLCRETREDAALADQLYRRTGCMPNVTYQIYTLRHLARQGMDLSGKRFLSQAGYNFYRMTGQRLESLCITSGMGLVNLDTSDYDELALEYAGIKKEQLSPLGTYRDTRPLNRELADRLGVPPGIPVVPPHADGALNQVGDGALKDGVMTFSVGTSAAIRLTAERPLLSAPPATWCYRGVEGWMSGAATAGACNCVKWFKKKLLRNRWTYRELERTLLSEDMLPVFLPFLYGERCPGWQDERMGCFYGLRGGDDITELFRAICEGVLFNVYQCYEILTSLAGEPKRIILSGGILHSPRWIQLCADIWGRELCLSDTPQASMLGGAALALHAAGEIGSLGEFSRPEPERVSPRPGAAEIYRRKYLTYLEWYDLCRGQQEKARG